MTDTTDSDEETINKENGLKKVGVAIFFRVCFGLILTVLGAVAIRYHNNRGIPYYLGGLLTGFTMSIAEVANIRKWLNIIRGTATKKEKDECVRVETILCAIAILFAIPGTVITGVNGIDNVPKCERYYNYRTCTYSDEIYEETTTFKLAVVLVVLLILSIAINIVGMCLCSALDRPKEKAVVTVRDQHQQESLMQGNSNNREPGTRGPHSGGLEMSTRHGQQQPFSRAALSTEPQQHDTGSSSTGFVLGTRHGQPQSFAGAVLSTGSQQPVSGYPSTGLVLNTRHGQPEPFAGAVQSTDAQQPILEANYRLISELQEQNRLLREQLALQQRRPESREQHVLPSAPSAAIAPPAETEAPPSYDTCVADPSRYTGL